MKASVGRFFVVLAAALFLAGCTVMPTQVKDYGSFEPDAAVTQAFETYQVNPDLNYYFSGSEIYPNAIMGLNKKYTLQESLWQKVRMTPKRLKNMVDAMQKKSDEMSLHLRGWSIRDESGREIGVWYSVLFATGSVKFEGDNKVSIDRPPQDIFTDYSDD